MYQKLSDLRKRLIVSIYIDFLRFCFPFFYIHWLMGHNTPSYFAARFKKYIGCLPTEYGKK